MGVERPKQTVTILDDCKPYPCPPKRRDLDVAPDATLGELRSAIASLCEYELDWFEFHVGPRVRPNSSSLLGFSFGFFV